MQAIQIENKNVIYLDEALFDWKSVTTLKLLGGKEIQGIW